MNTNSFWDDFGMPQLQPPPHYDHKSQNGIWILAIYIVAYREKHKILPFNKGYIIKAITAHEIKKGVYAQTPWNDTDPSSHDNTTAIVVLSYLYDLWFHKEVKILGKFWHPRDIIFYSRLKYGKVFQLFDFAMYIIMVQSCWKVFKFRDSKYDRAIHPIKTFVREFIHEWVPFVKLEGINEVVHSDGKFLTWIRCSTGLYKETWEDCQDILKLRTKHNWRFFIIDLYFHNPKHPLFELLL